MTNHKSIINLKEIVQTQNKWANKNIKETRKSHDKELSELFHKIDVLDIWSNNLHQNIIAEKLIKEIWMDAYISILLAIRGLYKYSNICLRSELETSLRLVYFFTHPIEYNWWLNGNDWFRKQDVWGEGYKYFEELDKVKDFDNNKSNDVKSDGKATLFKNIKILYGKFHRGPCFQEKTL